MKFNLNNKLLSIILSIFTYVSFIKMDILPSYNILSFIVFILISILFSKYLMFEKNFCKSSAVLSLIFSIATVFGRNFYAYYKDYSVNIWREIFSLKSLVYIIGLIPLFYVILSIAVKKLCAIEINELIYNKKKNLLFAIFSFILMFGVWGIYLLNFYPGTLSPDSIGEYSMFVNGLNVTRDHNPVLHILFMALFYNIGYGLFSNANVGVLFVSLAQITVMAAIFTYSLLFLRKRSCPKIIVYSLLAFYAFSPMHGFYAVTMWKDVLFAGFLLLLTIECYKLYENRDILNWKKLISFTTISLITVFLRNNAIYAYVIIAIALAIILRKHYKILLISFLLVFTTFFVVKGPVFNHFNISKSPSSEYIGMPLQQIGRIVAKGEELTANERKLIDELLPRETMASAYNPVVSDGIKFHPNFDIKPFNENKLDYAKMYVNMLFKHFDTSTEAYFISTLGYWYPNVNYWSVSTITWENDLGIYVDSKTNSTINQILLESESRDLPLFGMQWSIGLCVWLIAILAVTYIKKNKFKGIIPYLPCISVWLTMLIASPVWGEFRYVYGLFTSLPFLIGLFFIANKKTTKEDN